MLRYRILACIVRPTCSATQPTVVSTNSSLGGTMRATFIATAAIAAVLSSASAQAEPFKIRLSFIVPVSNWATMLFQHKENAKHLGQSYTFEPVRYRGTPDLVSALNAGELEIANMGYTT